MKKIGNAMFNEEAVKAMGEKEFVDSHPHLKDAKWYYYSIVGKRGSSKSSK